MMSRKNQKKKNRNKDKRDFVMSILHLDVNTLIYLGTTLIMGVGFIWKMKTDQTSTASVIKTELDYMKEIQEQNKEDFKQQLDEVKKDLKEDIGRLEEKQSESNRIKERLAIVEHVVSSEANKNMNINMTLLAKLLDKMENIQPESD